MTPLSLVVVISGSGSNLQAIIDAIDTGRLHARIVGVISNRPDAYGLIRATHHGLPSQVVDHTHFSQRHQFESALRQAIDHYQPELVVLAGFMRKLSPETVQHYAGRMLNIHPSLLPRHPGLHTHAKALAAGDTQHGATVHVVTEVVDAGPILGQAVLQIDASDTPDTLATRIHALEHSLYPAVLQQIALGHIPRINGCIVA